jgi:apolipoprotein N-acyltransferase
LVAVGVQSYLKTSSIKRAEVVRYLMAAAGGLLLSAAFPGVGLAGAAWIAPGVILGSGVGRGGWKTFRLGFVAGMAHYLTSLYWLLYMPYTFHGIPLAPGAGWLALGAYCASYTGFWVWFCWRLMPPSVAGLPARAAVEDFFAGGLLRRARWALACALVWVALEMARGWLLTGFPWNFLAVSQYRMLPLIQLTAVTGVAGLSFLMVWTSVALVVALVALTRHPGHGVWAEAGAPMLVAAVVAGYGASQVTTLPTPERELKVVLVQPAFAQTLIWDASQDEARFQDLLKLSEQALGQAPAEAEFSRGLQPLPERPALLVWPEGALSSLTLDHEAAIGKLLAKYKAGLVANVETEQPGEQGTTEFFNSAVLINAAGVTEGVYHKRRLVIFGEYVPKWLEVLKWMTPMDGELAAGTDAVPFKTSQPAARFSVLICFEDTFAEEGRAHVTAETDFLVNLTNDGWFGNSAQEWQHAANAVFRAVENGVPLVRCTNNGLTCWVDAQGRLREILGADGNVYAAGFMEASIPLRAAGERSRTFYNQHGDWFGWSCGGMTLCLCVGFFRPGSKISPVREDSVSK